MIQNAFTGEPKPASRPTLKLKPKTLAQQQSDFTAEGAPPAGNAAQTLLIESTDPAKPAQPPVAPDAGR